MVARHERLTEIFKAAGKLGRENTKDGEVIVSEVSFATAWYEERASILLPISPRGSNLEIELKKLREKVRVDYLLLSPIYINLYGPYKTIYEKEWEDLFLGKTDYRSLKVKKTASLGNGEKIILYQFGVQVKPF